MTKKYFNIIFFLLLSFQIQAQSFSIKITQVYPPGGVVYGDAYNLSGELDKAEATLRNKYSGRDANYTMELTRPSGKETKAIQNIRWIKVENGKKSNLKSKPSPDPQKSYSKPTTIEIYECNNNGSKKGGSTITDYDYYYLFSKGEVVDTIKEYRIFEN
jgi:hypothetical protein